MTDSPEKSLFDAIGGMQTVNATVDLFYEKILTDPRLAPFFEGMDMKRQRAHQKAFLTYAFGGAPFYDGKSLRKAHERLVVEKGLSDEHFEAFLENLKAALTELTIPPTLIEDVLAQVGLVRDDILSN